MPHGSARLSVYLKANKDYNNEFSEEGKILKVGRSPEVSWRMPHLPPPLTAFSAVAETYNLNFRGGIRRGGAYTPPVLKQGVHMHTLPHHCARL